MNIRRFTGANSRTVLAQVRAELGDDALILANRPVAGGIEILATSGDELEQRMAATDHDSARHSAARRDPASDFGRERPVERTVVPGTARATPADLAQRFARRDPQDDAARAARFAARAGVPAESLAADGSVHAVQPRSGWQAAAMARAPFVRETNDPALQSAEARSLAAYLQPQHDDLDDEGHDDEDDGALLARALAAPAPRAAAAGRNATPVTVLDADSAQFAGIVRSGRVTGDVATETPVHPVAAARPARPAETAAARAVTPEQPRDAAHDPQREASRAAQRERDGERDALLAEIRAMKDMLSEQIATLAWDETLRRNPLQAALTRELGTAGFSAALARTFTERLPHDFSPAEGRNWIAGALTRNLCLPEAPDLVEEGGVFALVGPTGVGKPTTAAKIAAQCVMRHGARSLGLITTDHYRVGAHDQLRVYGKILGVTVMTAHDAAELRHALDALAGKHLVLIDTTGMSQRDARVLAQQEMLNAARISRLVLLNATAQVETLDDVVRAYGSAGLAGAILTKLDEAVCKGGVLDVALRHKLVLHYVTRGQRVPEDIDLPVAAELVAEALQHTAGGAAPVADRGHA